MYPMDDELRPEYGEAVLKGGGRGEYAKRFAAGTNLVRIDPELAAAFAGDEALRWVLQQPGAVERLKKRCSEQGPP